MSLGRTNVKAGVRVSVWIKLKVGVRAWIAFFCLLVGVQITCLSQMIGFYGFLAGNKGRTEVLPLAITRAQPLYRSADIKAKLMYRIGYLPPIKYRVSQLP